MTTYCTNEINANAVDSYTCGDMAISDSTSSSNGCVYSSCVLVTSDSIGSSCTDSSTCTSSQCCASFI